MVGIVLYVYKLYATTLTYRMSHTVCDISYVTYVCAKLNAFRAVLLQLPGELSRLKDSYYET